MGKRSVEMIAASSSSAGGITISGRKAEMSEGRSSRASGTEGMHRRVSRISASICPSKMAISVLEARSWA